MTTQTLTEIRQVLHQHPELSGEEGATAERITAWIQECSPDELHLNVGGHGVLALFGSASDPLILFRAELDALPIQEANDIHHVSTRPGCAHLCGHDGHMSMLIGLARRWKEKPVPGVRLGLIFQPAEETGKGAAAVMIDPVFETLQPHRIFAYHNIPGKPLGQVMVRKGSMSSAVHSTILRFTGKESHAAEPHHAHSPGRAIAQLLLAAESMTSADRTDEAYTVVTPVFAKLGSHAYGTTPGQAEIHLTMRAGDDLRLATLQTLLLAFAAKLAKEDHLTLTHEVIEPFPASINHSDATVEVMKAVYELGADLVKLKTPYPWGEDMGHYLAAWPGTLIGLGSGVDQVPLHDPAFDFPDALIEPGVNLLYHLLTGYQKS